MKDKLRNVSIRYFKMHDADAEYVDECDGFIVFNTVEGLVFVNVTYSTEAFEESDRETLRWVFEHAAVEFISEHNEDYGDVRVRCDEVCIWAIKPDRAFVKHHVNIVGLE